MNTATHTPTPWYCDNAAGTTIWNAAGHGLIAECPEPAEWLGAKKLDRAANAAFIVRACNAYDGLIARLSAVEALAAEWELAASESSGQTRETFAESAELLRAALAKAGAA